MVRPAPACLAFIAVLGGPAVPAGAQILFEPPAVAETAPYARRVVVGDIDEDGWLDLVTSRYQIFPISFGPSMLSLGLGNGQFAAPASLPVGFVFRLADFDGDARPDIVAAEFQSALATRSLRNHTYEAGSPFLDLGAALAGSNGAPIQLADSTLLAGEPYSFRLAVGPPLGVAYHVVGVTALNAHFKGGLLIPAPTLLNGPLPLDASGGLALTGSWLPGMSGLVLYLQFWMPQAGGPLGFAASSGVRAQVP